jgi:hypothetical protein
MFTRKYRGGREKLQREPREKFKRGLREKYQENSVKRWEKKREKKKGIQTNQGLGANCLFLLAWVGKFFNVKKVELQPDN